MSTALPPATSDRDIHWGFAPRTRIGRWALALLVGGLVLMLVPNMIWGPGPPHTGTMIATAAGFLAILTSPILTGIAMIRRSERSILLLVVCFLLTAFVLVFLVGEAFVEGSS